MIRCGIDLGGTKIAIACLDEAHQLVFEKRVNTPQGNYPQTLDAICQLVFEAEKNLAVNLPVGIGTPGSISSKTGLMKNSNSTCLNNQPLKQDLEKQLNRPVKIANDANCFALSETIDGAAKGRDVVFGVIIGTGTGAGIVVREQVLDGANRIAGEWGHNPMPWTESQLLQARNCYCGKTGCIETFLCGPGFENDFYLATNNRLRSEQIVRAAEAGDQACESALANYERYMAKALAHVINILDPDCIVLGGGMSNIQRLYQNVPEIWGEYVFSDSICTELLPPRFGDASGVRGAARLWRLDEIQP